ncbi:MAG TPA: T6SS effector amidase Tae4 family protein [Candidatus Dormibacteraeota bacterium]|nr:T6SS effector amidase Tae4 family protein [Candidatus Dormibacteraeota bacterium]
MAELPKSSVRLSFEQSVKTGAWKQAFRDFNGLNMYEMLRAYRDLDPTTRALFWSQKDKKTSADAGPDIPNTQPGEIPRMQYAVSVIDDGQIPDGAAPGDLSATGQEEDAREFLAPVPDKLSGFTFDKLLAQYPTGDVDDVKTRIGGKVNADWITNTCAIRISRVLNYNSVAIPGPKASTLDVVSGGDHRWYSYRQIQLQAWFKGMFGGPSITMVRPVNRRKLKNLKGFIGFDIHFPDATGHFDLWDGDQFETEAETVGRHDYFAEANSVVFWRVPSWTRP